MSERVRKQADLADELVRRRTRDAFRETAGEHEGTAAQQDVARRLGQNSTGAGEVLAGSDQIARAAVLTQLQQTYGNHAVQRLLQRSHHAAAVVQRDPDTSASPGWSFSPIKPAPFDATAAGNAGVAKVVEQEAKERALVFSWLDANPGEANLWATGLQTMDALIAKVRQKAAGADKLAEQTIRHNILAWAQQHNVKPQPGTHATGDVLRDRIEAAVQGALGLVSDGVSVTLVERKDLSGGNKLSFTVNVSVQGATAKLKLGGAELSGTVAYDKGVKASLGNDLLNFSAEMTPDKWALKLNIGLDPEVPDLSSVGSVFDKAQRGLSDLVSHPEKQSQSDVNSALRDAGEAFDALSGIAKAPSVSASIGIGSTDTGGPSTGGAPAVPKGWQITVMVSGRF